MSKRERIPITTAGEEAFHLTTLRPKFSNFTTKAHRSDNKASFDYP